MTETFAGSNIFTAQFHYDGEFKFRYNNNWEQNYGTTAAPSGSLVQNGVSINAVQLPAPRYYNVTINLNTYEYIASINKEDPTLSNFSIPTKKYGDSSFQITHPTSTSSGSFSYASSNLLVATIHENIITVVGAGNSIITAIQQATPEYNSGTITTTFQVNQSTPTITGVVIGSTKLSIVVTGTFFLNVNSILINGSIYPSSFIINSDTSITATLFTVTAINSVQVTKNSSSSNLFNVDPPIYPICFVAGTPILTDQGIISIEKIKPKLHTIQKKKIVAITQTITNEEHLICIEKNALGDNIPSEKTIISCWHRVLYKQKLLPAKYLKRFVENKNSIYNIKYNREILYNILMKKHERIKVNNMICETLNPTNIIAKLYSGKYNEMQKCELIIEINECMKNNDLNKCEEISRKMR